MYLLHPGTAATLAYCTNPDDRWGWFLEQLVEWKLAGETEVLRRKPTPASLCPPQNPTWQTRSRTPERSGGKPAINRLSYGTAFFSPISSPLTTRRVTVEVFYPASTRVWRLGVSLNMTMILDIVYHHIIFRAWNFFWCQVMTISF
jgi:hypothetical protein